jgi:hypothetical protein
LLTILAHIADDAFREAESDLAALDLAKLDWVCSNLLGTSWENFNNLISQKFVSQFLDSLSSVDDEGPVLGSTKLQEDAAAIFQGLQTIRQQAAQIASKGTTIEVSAYQNHPEVLASKPHVALLAFVTEIPRRCPAAITDKHPL